MKKSKDEAGRMKRTAWPAAALFFLMLGCGCTQPCDGPSELPPPPSVSAAERSRLMSEFNRLQPGTSFKEVVRVLGEPNAERGNDYRWSVDWYDIPVAARFAWDEERGEMLLESTELLQ